MKEESMRILIREMIGEMLSDSRIRPDFEYTNWIPSDVSYLEGKGFEYDEDDDSFFIYHHREGMRVMIQKNNGQKYLIKTINTDTDGILFNAVAQSQEDLFRLVAQAMRVARGEN